MCNASDKCRKTTETALNNLQTKRNSVRKTHCVFNDQWNWNWIEEQSVWLTLVYTGPVGLRKDKRKQACKDGCMAGIKQEKKEWRKKEEFKQHTYFSAPFMDLLKLLKHVFPTNLLQTYKLKLGWLFFLAVSYERYVDSVEDCSRSVRMHQQTCISIWNIWSRACVHQKANKINT